MCTAFRLAPEGRTSIEERAFLLVLGFRKDACWIERLGKKDEEDATLQQTV